MATTWFSLLNSGHATPADRERWQIWLTSGPESQAAWAFVERVSQRFAPLHTAPTPRFPTRRTQIEGQPAIP